MAIPIDIDPTAVGQTAEGITNLCDDSLAKAELLLSEIRGLSKAPDDALTFEATLGKLDDAVLYMHHAADFAQLMSSVHPDPAVREAARGCEPKVSRFDTALFLDPELAIVFKRFAGRKLQLPPVQARFLEHVLRDFRRNGLDLEATKQDRLKQLNDEITTLAQAFDTNLAEATLYYEATPEQLEGLPDNYRSEHQPGPNGKIKISTDYPDYSPVITYAKDRNLAKELYKLFDNRAVDKNLPILDKILKLRHEKANLLGYPTWADFVLEPRMAKNAQTVSSFLESVRSHLERQGAEEIKEYRAKHAKLGGKESDPIPPCDRLYLEDQLRHEKYGLDSKKLGEYFEVTRVTQGVLEITSKLFGIQYKPSSAPVWHSDVKAYDVIDTASNKLIGRFYMDLYPRADKYKHAAVFGIRETKKLQDSSRLFPIAAIVCNFPRPGGAPALLPHSEVTTFFHEFGHVLHHLLSESELASFAGTAVARDFVEAPSQMLEEWAWSRETLDSFARHYATGEKIPQTLFDAMIRSRGFGRALGTQRQIFLSALDQAYHTRQPGFDTTTVLKELHSRYTAFEYVEGTHFQATFGHLMGYDAGYYGYQWALAIAQDLFTRFKKDGLMNAQTAKDYRAMVLSKGGSEDENQMVEKFLGRAPNDAAYRAYLSGQ